MSSEPASPETFTEYGLRFRVEEEFLDEKSNDAVCYLQVDIEAEKRGW